MTGKCELQMYNVRARAHLKTRHLEHGLSGAVLDARPMACVCCRPVRLFCMGAHCAGAATCSLHGIWQACAQGPELQGLCFMPE